MPKPVWLPDAFNEDRNRTVTGHNKGAYTIRGFVQNINWGKVKGIIGKFGQCAKQTLTVHRPTVISKLK